MRPPYPCYQVHLCPPLSLAIHVLLSLRLTSYYLLSLIHTSAVHHGDGRFRCAAQVNQGHCYRQFHLHQLSPATLVT